MVYGTYMYRLSVIVRIIMITGIRTRYQLVLGYLHSKHVSQPMMRGISLGNSNLAVYECM